MNFDVFCLKNSDVYRIAYSSITCIYSYFLQNLYSRLSAAFFSNVVTKKRVFFSCYLFVIFNINSLVRKIGKKGESEWLRFKKIEKWVYIHVYLYIRYTIYNGFFGGKT